MIFRGDAMNKCLECNAEPARLDNEHLAACCGLTLQEYAIRHGLPLDIVVPRALLDHESPLSDYPKRAVRVPRKAQVVLAAVRAVGMFEERRRWCVIPGEIRRLDQLLSLAQSLQDYGFRFRQSYRFDPRAHRVTASNRLQAPRDNLAGTVPVALAQLSASEFLLFAAVAVALRSDLYGGYVFLHLADRTAAGAFTQRLKAELGVTMKALAPVAGEGAYLRTLTSADARTLLGALRPQLSQIPCTHERFYADGPEASPQALVAKELVFDSAHFITDHPDKCANLHGGRYNLVVKVKDRIDPYTGFVVDYGYLKAVVQREVIEKFDHRHLNLSDAGLGWRSSTELINLLIWRRLIEYLPNLHELQTYETTQSYCCFQGPALDEMHEFGRLNGSHFESAALGRSTLRRLLSAERLAPHLTIVGEE